MPALASMRGTPKGSWSGVNSSRLRRSPFPVVCNVPACQPSIGTKVSTKKIAMTSEGGYNAAHSHLRRNWLSVGSVITPAKEAKMKRKLALAVTTVAIVLVAGAGVLALQTSVGSNEIPGLGGIPLVRPAIAQGVSFLDTEAGMSAYANTGLTINLDNARAAFRTVERQTDTWLIGSVAIPGHPEEEDAHVFVHQQGWIVAYYERGSPVARTVHWTGHPTLGPNKLEQALGLVASNAGVPIPSAGFFNFQLPNATEWLLIIDNDSFGVTIPKEFAVFERSYSQFSTDLGSCSAGSFSRITIDGTVIAQQSGCVGFGTFHGLISAATLSQDASHLVDTPDLRRAGSVAISLLYLPPP